MAFMLKKAIIEFQATTKQVMLMFPTKYIFICVPRILSLTNVYALQILMRRGEDKTASDKRRCRHKADSLKNDGLKTCHSLRPLQVIRL